MNIDFIEVVEEPNRVCARFQVDDHQQLVGVSRTLADSMWRETPYEELLRRLGPLRIQLMQLRGESQDVVPLIVSDDMHKDNDTLDIMSVGEAEQHLQEQIKDLMDDQKRIGFKAA